jgi:hypothetical protein
MNGHMDTSTSDFVRAGSLEELKARRRLLVHGRHRPILLVEEGGQVFALDNRCPHTLSGEAATPSEHSPLGAAMTLRDSIFPTATSGSM